MGQRFLADLLGAHLDGVKVMRRLPLLFTIIIGFELVQHLVEMRVGLYRDARSAHAHNYDTSRLEVGFVKMTLIYASSFFVIRSLVARSRGVCLMPIGKAATRYAPYVLYSLAVFSIILLAPELVKSEGGKAIRFVASLFQLLLEPALMMWIVSSASDGEVRNPFQSARLTGALYFWSLAMFFMGRMAVNAIHQVVARSAVGHDGPTLWAMLAVDAVSVGLIAGVMPALYVRVACFIHERRSAQTGIPSAGQGRFSRRSAR